MVTRNNIYGYQCKREKRERERERERERVITPFIGPIGVIGDEKRLEDDLRENFTRLVTEPVHILSDTLVTAE